MTRITLFKTILGKFDYNEGFVQLENISILIEGMCVDRNKKLRCFRGDVLHEMVDSLFPDRPDPDSRRTYAPLYNSSYVGAFYSTTKGNSTPLFSIGPTLPRAELYNVQNYTISLCDLPSPSPVSFSLTLPEFVDCKRYSCILQHNTKVFQRQIFFYAAVISFRSGKCEFLSGAFAPRDNKAILLLPPLRANISEGSFLFAPLKVEIIQKHFDDKRFGGAKSPSRFLLLDSPGEGGGGGAS